MREPNFLKIGPYAIAYHYKLDGYRTYYCSEEVDAFFQAQSQPSSFCKRCIDVCRMCPPICTCTCHKKASQPERKTSIEWERDVFEEWAKKHGIDRVKTHASSHYEHDKYVYNVAHYAWLSWLASRGISADYSTAPTVPSDFDLDTSG